MPVPIPPEPPNPKGSLGFGIALAWICLIGGYVLVALFAGVAVHGPSETTVVIWLLLPWISMVVAAVWSAAAGKTRTAIGVGVGFASIVGVFLLLMAACFGIIGINR